MLRTRCFGCLFDIANLSIIFILSEAPLLYRSIFSTNACRLRVEPIYPCTLLNGNEYPSSTSPNLALAVAYSTFVVVSTVVGIYSKQQRSVPVCFVCLVRWALSACADGISDRLVEFDRFGRSAK
jgi:hypothetical protein